MALRKFKFYFGQATARFGRFSHEAHLYAAWLMLQDAPSLPALAEFRRGILELARASGRADKYHETLMVAWFLLVLERLRAGESWEEFIRRCPDLLDVGLLERFYAAGVLGSERARREFVLPE